MVFSPPAWVPKLPELPDSVPIAEVMLNEKYGRHPIADSRDPYTCGLTGRTYSVQQVKDRVTHLSRALAKELGWGVNQGTEYDKVAGVFSINTIDSMTLSWAIHRLNGISSPANAQYSASELAYQIENSGASCLFTCLPLLPTALEAAKKANLSKDRIYLISVPDPLTGGAKAPSGMKSTDDLISMGASLPPLPEQNWTKGQATRQTAFLCYSSGTSGLPKGVQISHFNVIANSIQKAVYDGVWSRKHNGGKTEIALGLLPMSHIYALVAICHTSTYSGSSVVVLPKFDLEMLLRSIARFRIELLFLVPPIAIICTKQPQVLAKYDLTCVRHVFCGAAPMGKETVAELPKVFHGLESAIQGYGLTETSTVVCVEARDDKWPGSVGSLFPGTLARLVDRDGNEVTTHNTPGELWVNSPSVTLGYLKNPKATAETYVVDKEGNRWLRTGDEVEIRKHPESGNEHLFVVDRIKELIKVKGNQVAPAELEAHLLTHPLVADCAVISIPDPSSGERPKAYVVKSARVGLEDSDQLLKREIMKHVEQSKTRYKWLKEIEFIDIIPKSPSGKILRRLLRDKDRASRKAKL